MLSVFTVFSSLLIASAAAGPLQARAACNPAVAGKGINIVNGQFQLGYPSGAYFANVPIEAEALTTPLTPVFTVDASGNGLLSVNNAPAGATPLYPTEVDRFQLLLEPRISGSPGNFSQGFSFVCSQCSDPTIAHGCAVISDATGQCVQIGTAVGQTASISQCTGQSVGNQAFTVVIS
ncbi:hypothetical protein R3P38DRAFT_2883022 [Favolaschia claudopus]|uniref:Uncharacterized protein n=1 Tax=Favolaschia claudopus TaxID=2862362 RepID=A0AAW0CZA5_9AGAR